MIICPECTKENQDHYKFCLGCGAELPKDAPKQFQAEPRSQTAAPAAPSPAEEPHVPAKVAEPAPAAVAAPAAPVAAPAAAPECPQCGHENEVGNRFCAACGYKLSAGAAPAVAAAPAAPKMSHVKLTALRADGSEAGFYQLPLEAEVVVGRDTGTIFAGDSYLSPQHARFVINGASVHVSDAGSLNGVYVKLAPNSPHALSDGDVFRIGQEIMRYEQLSPEAPQNGVERLGSPARDIVGRLALVIGRNTTGNAFPVPARGLHLGRERGDVLFSEDGYVSGLHCQVAPDANGQVFLTDVGSSNGTFVRVREEHALSHGDILLMGQQVFRVEL